VVEGGEKEGGRKSEREIEREREATGDEPLKLPSTSHTGCPAAETGYRE